MNAVPRFWRSWLGLLLCGSAARALVLDVPQCYQEQDQWCWAASAQAVLAFYGTNVSQGQVAQYATDGANTWDFLYGSSSSPLREGVDHILDHFRGIASGGAGYDLSQDEIEAELREGRPVVILWMWDSGPPGHILVVSGISNDIVYLMDPLNGPTISTFSWVQQGAGHTYIDTLRLGTSSGLMVAAPGSQDFGIVALGGTSDRSFEITNAGRGIMAGEVVATPPFAVLSNGQFSLREGEARTISVRYAPVMSGSDTQQIHFTGGGGSTSAVSGTAFGLRISAQPVDQIIPKGSTTLFSVAAEGTPPLAYQWRFNGLPVSNATNSTFLIPSSTIADSGAYAVEITNNFARITSSLASLAVVSAVRAGGTNAVLQGLPGATNLVALASGKSHRIGLGGDGSVIAWGDNTFGQTTVPADAFGAVAVTAGGDHNLALRADGRVIAWGANSAGQCVVRGDATNVVGVAAGESHSLALLHHGRVVAWGDDSVGQCDVPPAATNVIAVAAGQGHSLALKADGTLIGWGNNLFGQTASPNLSLPIKAISAGQFHNLALLANGSVVAWGDNAVGQTNVPAGLSNVVFVAAGAKHSLALLADGGVVAWGGDSFGQSTLACTFSNMVGIAAGYSDSLGLLDEPTLRFRLFPGTSGPAFELRCPLICRKTYTLETNSLLNTSWGALSSVIGDGHPHLWAVPAFDRQLFIRLRMSP